LQVTGIGQVAHSDTIGCRLRTPAGTPGRRPAPVSRPLSDSWCPRTLLSRCCRAMCAHYRRMCAQPGGGYLVICARGGPCYRAEPCSLSSRYTYESAEGGSIGLDHGVGHPRSLCARPKHLSTGGGWYLRSQVSPCRGRYGDQCHDRDTPLDVLSTVMALVQEGKPVLAEDDAG
jgi:hypothetical protein